jgi:hypothetical protein
MSARRGVRAHQQASRRLDRHGRDDPGTPGAEKGFLIIRIVLDAGTAIADCAVPIASCAAERLNETESRFADNHGRLGLCRLSVRRHQSEVVLGVLVVVLRADDIPRPGFLLG